MKATFYAAFCSFLFLLFLGGSVQAQVEDEYAAIGDRYFANEDFYEAARQYEKAIRRQPEAAYPQFRLAK